MVSPVPTIYAARILHFPQAWLVLLGAVEVIFMGFFLQGEFTSTTMVRYTLQQFDIAMMLWRITILAGKRLNPMGQFPQLCEITRGHKYMEMNAA